jgi:hypothetical protein
MTFLQMFAFVSDFKTKCLEVVVLHGRCASSHWEHIQPQLMTYVVSVLSRESLGLKAEQRIMGLARFQHTTSSLTATIERILANTSV